MSDLVLKMADLARPLTDADRIDQIDRLAANCWRSLNIWDQDFITDMHGRTVFSPRQRAEIDRIWKQWEGNC